LINPPPLAGRLPSSDRLEISAKSWNLKARPLNWQIRCYIR